MDLANTINFVVFLEKDQPMSNMEKLIHGFGNGDIGAHQFFFQLHKTELHRFSTVLIGDKKAVKKLVAQVAIQLWYRDNKTLVTSSDIKALYFRTLKKITRDHLRNEYDEKYEIYRSRLDAFIEQVNISAKNEPFVDSLSPDSIAKARTVLQRVFSNPDTYAQIAAKLRIPVGEVPHYLEIARCSLKIILSENL